MNITERRMKELCEELEDQQIENIAIDGFGELEFDEYLAEKAIEEIVHVAKIKYGVDFLKETYREKSLYVDRWGKRSEREYDDEYLTTDLLNEFVRDENERYLYRDELIGVFQDKIDNYGRYGEEEDEDGYIEKLNAQIKDIRGYEDDSVFFLNENDDWDCVGGEDMTEFSPRSGVDLWIGYKTTLVFDK